MKKYISILLAAVMAASTVSFSAFAENYPQNGAYYNDFSEGEVTTSTNRANTWSYTVNLDNSNIVTMKRGASGTTAEIQNEKITVLGGDYTTSGEVLSRTFVRFDKDFDVSADTEENLIVEYDITVDSVNLTEGITSIVGTQFAGGLFEYVNSTTPSTGIFHNQGGAFGNIGGNIGMAINVPEGGKTAGIFMQNANSFDTKGATGAYKLWTVGILGRQLGNVFHVTYEVTPATETEKAMISKITISDSEASVTLSVEELNGKHDSYNHFKLADGKSKISGIRFDSWSGVDYSIDNLKAYYKNTDDPTATAVNNSSEITLKDKLEIKLNCWIDESTADGIEVKCGDDVINKASVDVKRSKDTYETNVEVTVPDMQYGKTYTVVIPDTLLSENKTAFKETALSWTTEPLPNINPTLTVSGGAESVAELNELAGKYATCKVSATTKKNVSALLVVGLYDGDDKLVSYGAEYAAFENGKNEEMTVSFPIPSDTEGMSIKAFACESLEKASVKLGSVAVLD